MALADGGSERQHRSAQVNPHDQEAPAWVYLCEQLTEDMAAIVKVTRTRSLLSFGTQGYVKLGASVAVAQRSSRPAILINLQASKSEGSDLDSRLLSLAEIVE